VPLSDDQALAPPELAALLRWYADMGIDLAIDEHPHDRFAESAAAAPLHKTPPPALALSAPAAPVIWRPIRVGSKFGAEFTEDLGIQDVSVCRRGRISALTKPLKLLASKKFFAGGR
jgi:hypothetical protein